MLVRLIIPLITLLLGVPTPAWGVAGTGITAPTSPAPGMGQTLYLADDDENGWEDEDEEGEEISEGFAKLSAMALFVNGLYIPYKWVRNILGIRLKWALSVHMLAGYLATGFALLHGYTAEECNTFIGVGLGLMVYATIGGLLLRYKWVPSEAKRGLLLLHAQRISFYILLAALAVGHLLVED